MAQRRYGTLTAGTVGSVQVGTAAEPGRRREVESVELVVLEGAAPVFFTIDGTAPTVRGDDTYVCPPGGSVRVGVDRQAPVTVRMVSDSAVTFGLEAL